MPTDNDFKCDALCFFVRSFLPEENFLGRIGEKGIKKEKRRNCVKHEAKTCEVQLGVKWILLFSLVAYRSASH